MTPAGSGAARADQMSILSRWVSCLAIILLPHPAVSLSVQCDVSSRDSRDLPGMLAVVLPCVRDRRAAPAMLAVPSVSVEEDQMRAGPPVHAFVHAIEKLYRCARSAFLLRVELAYRHANDRYGLGARDLARLLDLHRSTPGPPAGDCDALRRPGLRPRRAGGALGGLG